MKIGCLPPAAPVANSLVTEHAPRPFPDAGHEAELRLRNGQGLTFSTGDGVSAQREREQWMADLADYLGAGYLSGQDADGPVQRMIATASHSGGVEPDEVNLQLREGVEVFGFLDNQGVGNCYYARWVRHGQLEFFTLCIESGESTGGPYDIFVSPARDWPGFLSTLPAT